MVTTHSTKHYLAASADEERDEWGQTVGPHIASAAAQDQSSVTVSGDRGYRYGWVIPAVTILLIAGITWSPRSTSPHPVDTNPIRCSTGHPLSCYYIYSDRPVIGAKSLTYDGQTVPVVGVLPYKCYAHVAGCSVAGRVGPYVVWDLNPSVNFQLAAIYSPASVPPST